MVELIIDDNLGMIHLKWSDGSTYYRAYCQFMKMTRSSHLKCADMEERHSIQRQIRFFIIWC